jgi:hypothetical protein
MDFFLQAAVSSIAVGSERRRTGAVLPLGGAFVSCTSTCIFFGATATEITLLSAMQVRPPRHVRKAPKPDSFTAADTAIFIFPAMPFG